MGFIFKYNRKCHARPVRASGISSPRPPHKAVATSIAGNILIYILGAIFLMGLLLVSLKGSFQEGTGIDPEKTALLVGQVQRYGAELERGVAYVLRNGYSETDIRFAHPNASSAYGDITDIPARQVFAPEGGGVEWRAPPAGSQVTVTPWYFNAKNSAQRIGTTCSGSTCTDMIAFLPNVTQSFCETINKIKGRSPLLPLEDGCASVTSEYTGNLTWDFNMACSLDNTSDGATEGCFEGSGTPPAETYTYYRVLLAR